MTTLVTQILRPNALRETYGSWSVVGAGSDVAANNDANDGTYNQADLNVQSAYKRFELSSVALPAGFTPKQIGFSIRVQHITGAVNNNGFYAALRRSDDVDILGSPSPLTVYDYQGIYQWDSGMYNYSFTQGIVDGLYIHVAALFSSLFNAGDKARVMDVWATITYEYNAAPGTPTGLAVTSAVTTTSPTFQATVPDDGTAKARFEIYQNDGVTLVGTVDSSFVTGNTVASATYGAALPVGQYKVRAQTIDDVSQTSGWTSLVSFQILTSVNKDANFLWNVADPTTPVSKDLNLLWNVQVNNQKELTALWNTYQAVIKDLTMLWKVSTAWTDVPDDAGTIWSEVEEG
jgi:hypothetical protein